MNYTEAIQFLYDLRLFGARFGLETTMKLAALAGNPHERLRFIHVAGTNGKGSTCAMVESIYRASGLRVGLFTSPHLVAFGERIQVNRQLVPETEIIRLVCEMKPWLETFPGDSSPTLFEVVTIMALRYFDEQRCDLVIWETGLGGRLDATNIVTPLASVVTNIDFDHQQWLGDTLAKIAFEKAGIIKSGVPVITGATRHPEALQVITETAHRLHAPLTIVTREGIDHETRNTEHLPLLGDHQKRNAALALATVRVLMKQLPISDETMRTGLTSVSWPGRLQIVRTAGGRTLVLDGAHNPAGVEALCAAFRCRFPEMNPTIVLGVLRDKDWESMCATLSKLAGRMVLVPLKSERTLSPEELNSACLRAAQQMPVSTCSSLSDALQSTANDPLLLITGSLYLVGEAMELLRLSPGPAGDERALNEWTARSVATASSS